MTKKPSNPSLQYITLLDVFAAAWMAGAMAYPADEPPSEREAYAVALRMLEARKEFLG